jgi:hypothetical protein
MAGVHPDEYALLDYVDGEGDPAVAAHVSSCAACTDQVRLLEAGRDALRSAPLLELGEERRKVLVRGLPERERRRPFAARLGPAAAAAAALVLVAGIVALATLTGGGGGSDEGGGMAGGGAAAEGQSDAAGTPTTGTRAAQAQGAPVRRVKGPPSAVLRLLHGRGIPAVLLDGSVVAKADRDDVQLALKDRPPGAVAVYVR